jgi:hypothetical protein
MFFAYFCRTTFVLECTPSPSGVKIQVEDFPNGFANPVTKKAGIQWEQEELSRPGHLAGLQSKSAVH